MTPFALMLVLTAAFLHASWDLLAKRAGGGAVFVWLVSFLSALLYAPLTVLLFVFERPVMGSMTLLFIVGSAILHIVYFLLL